ncbi:MAG: hypothetical protein JSR15_10795, partial [Proteobacteria bacterium]|nr:hypothetical protein [Pseudomonadota bacterium]
MRFQSVALNSKPITAILAAVMASVFLGASAGALAQQTGLSGAMQAFSNLPPDQQQAILQKLGGQSTGSTGLQGSTSGAQGPSTAAATSTPNSVHSGTSDQTPPSGPPVFMPEDSLLLDINLPGERSVAQLGADDYERQLKAASNSSLGSQALAGAAGAAIGDVAPTQSMLDAVTLANDRDLIKVLSTGNPYQLDRDGLLQLPGFRGIALAGLTEIEATRRLAAEPALHDMEIRVIRLPVARMGTAALTPYGYDLFANGQQGMSPV